MKSKTFKPTKYLKPFLGEKPKIFDVVMSIIVAFVVSVVYFIIMINSYIDINLFKKIILSVIMFELVFSFIMHLSDSLDKYYYNKIKRELLYIFLNIQPLIIMFLVNNINFHYLFLWLFVSISSLIIIVIKDKGLQKIVGFSFLILALLLFPWCFKNENYIYNIVLFAYVSKMLYSFSIDQYDVNKNKNDFNKSNKYY